MMEERGYTIFIKNMVCNRCILVVTEVFKKLKFTPLKVELGKVSVQKQLTSEELETVKEALEQLGFELIEDKRQRTIEQIRTAIIELVYYKNNLSKLKLSEYLKDKCNHDYSFLSKLFSDVTGSSIEKYYIAQKVERIKELLVYGELSVSEIANQLHYSSVAHLSKQFRDVTGMSPSEFKLLKSPNREPLDRV